MTPEAFIYGREPSPSVAQPPMPPGPYWQPSPRPSGLASPAGIVVIIVAVVFVVLFAVVLVTGLSIVPGFPVIMFAPVCAVGVAVLVVVLLAVSQAWNRAPIPPPPPIQQTMVPAGAQSPVGLNCPACGAPAQDVDRFGVAVCPHCSTRFLVR